MLAKYREVSFHYDTNYIAVFIENSIMIVSSNTILSLYLQYYMKYYLNPAIVFDKMMCCIFGLCMLHYPHRVKIQFNQRRRK